MSRAMTGDDGLVTEPKEPDKSLGELFSDLGQEMAVFFRKEVQLAKTEAREELHATRDAAIGFGAMAIAGWLAIVMLSFALAWLLDQAMNRALAFAIVGAAWLIVALIEFAMGRARMKRVKPMPETSESIKEDVQWVKQQVN